MSRLDSTGGSEGGAGSGTDRPPAVPGSSTPPCVVHEDDDLLVVHKPAGWNTHAPSPHAGEGIYEWLRHREPRWATLAIVHRLDKETSGLLVFGKSTRANRSLTEQFSGRAVDKRYLLHVRGALRGTSPTARVEALPEGRIRVTSWIHRDGDAYVGRATGIAGEEAVTEFGPAGSGPEGVSVWEARPSTGRTHQIRVHAAALGQPILGDALYGGSPAERVWLQSVGIRFLHPGSGEPVEFGLPRESPGDGEPWSIVRAILRDAETDAFRWLHGASAGLPGVHVERLHRHLLVQTVGDVPDLSGRPRPFGFVEDGVYAKRLRRDVRQTAVVETCPTLVSGVAAPERFAVCENGVRYDVSFGEGYSYGLFLDQRDNRRRLLANHVAAGFPLFPEGAAGREVLNCFAYTCAFSVCAARAGARATSLDLSRKYLDWGRRNFALNGLDPSDHDFIFGDCFDWMRRLAKKGRRFDAVLLDPPTFSRSREHGDFRAETDYGDLVRAAMALLVPGGVLFASTNAARVAPEGFVATVSAAVAAEGRGVLSQHYVPQPPDFPVSRAEPAHLKTVWTRVS